MTSTITKINGEKKSQEDIQVNTANLPPVWTLALPQVSGKRRRRDKKSASRDTMCLVWEEPQGRVVCQGQGNRNRVWSRHKESPWLKSSEQLQDTLQPCYYVLSGTNTRHWYATAFQKDETGNLSSFKKTFASEQLQATHYQPPS